MGELDASVFHRYAEYLWRRAGGMVIRWTIGGALLGAVLGTVMLSSWAHWPIPHREAYLVIVLGAVSGAVLGRSLGVSRALGLRLQAQLAQHQLEFERSTLAQAAALRQEPVEAPAQVSAPVAPPYVPAGVPPVSAVEPAAVEAATLPVPEPAAAPPPIAEPPVLERERSEGYGWAALEPSGLS